MNIFVDGAAEQNPNGPMGIGIAIYDGDRLLEEHHARKGIGSNITAEYLAVVAGLEIAATRPYRNATVHSDCEVVVRQLLGVYDVRHEHLQALHDRAATLLEHTASQMQWIPRTANRHADFLSKQALNAVFVIQAYHREAAARAANAPDSGLPPIAPEMRDLLARLASAPAYAISDLVIGLRPGHDAYSAIDATRLQDIVRARHGRQELERLEVSIALRSPKTKTHAYRWAARGLTVDFTLLRLDLEKELRKPYLRPKP